MAFWGCSADVRVNPGSLPQVGRKLEAAATRDRYTPRAMAVPWAQIVRWAPQILAVSRDLLQRSRRDGGPAQPARAAADDNLPARIRLLEENERRQAELVDRMAAQQAELAQAVLALHRQLRWLVAGAVVLAVLLGVALYAFVRTA